MQQQQRRSGIIPGLVAFGLLAWVALTAHPAQAFTSAAGPYYAEPAWDQKLPNATRFMVLTNWANAAVLDQETGLVWERSPATFSVKWADAKNGCLDRTTGNRKGWRLPSIHELTSLIFPSQVNPALQPGHPFLSIESSNDAFGYWSATTKVDVGGGVWTVRFSNGSVPTDYPDSVNYALCVRGGGPLSEY